MSATTATAGRPGPTNPWPAPWPPLLSAVAAAGAVVGLSVATGGGGAELAAQVAGLALAAAAGYLLDDPAAAVTQTVPRPLWRRRSATVVRGLAVLSATWILLLALLKWLDGGVSAVQPDHRDDRDRAARRHRRRAAGPAR